MPLESVTELMRDAVTNGYAIGYFESWNLESLEGVIDAGFNLVMPDGEGVSYDRYLRMVSELTTYAHSRGVAVEAELGDLPFGLSCEGPQDGSVTDPDQAARFVQATGVDLLAVGVGNVHVLTAGRRELDLNQLAAIRKRVSIPLVLHGGTGIDCRSLQQAIALGVAKVNYGTYLK